MKTVSRLSIVSLFLMSSLAWAAHHENKGDHAKKAMKKAAPAAMKKGGNPVVVMETSKGTIEIELDAKKAPLSTANFVQYAKSGFYKDTVFHRIMKNFMIQGGGMTADGNRKKTKPAIKNEAFNGLSNKRGTIAMARTGDPHSGTSQFFINVVDNVGLDHRSKSDGRSWGYAVFGKVVKGMDVVDAIRNTEVSRSAMGENSKPKETITIKKTSVR